MNKKIKVIVGLLLLAVIFLTPVILADEYMYSPIVFTVPTVLSFQVTIPGPVINGSEPTFPGNTTTDIWFNATDSNSKFVVPCTGVSVGADCQSPIGTWTTPIFLFKNTGTTSFNITMRLNESLAAALKLWGNFSYPTGSGPGGGCTDATLGANDTVMSTTDFYFTKALCISNETQVWMWANFTGATGTYYNVLNYTSTTT